MQVVTVTCDRDRALQRLQSHSFDLFVTNPIEHWVVIETTQWSIDQWIEYLSPFYTRHTLKVVVLPMSRTTPAHWGWIRQQILKLKIASLVETESYIVFDSKNFAFRAVDLSTWSIDEGNGRVANEMLQNGHWLLWLEHCEKTIGRAMPTSYWSPITPFVFKTSAVRKLLNEIDVEEIFFSHDISSQSEFMLYRFFNDTEPSDGNNGCISFWSNGSYPGPETIDQLYSDITKFFTGYHKHLIDKFDPNMVHIIEYMVTLGIDRQIIFEGLTSLIKPQPLK
jgi:hypothetical protein